jgi:hypothetical protein
MCEDRYPFEQIELIPRARKNFIKRFWLKYIMQKPPVYYRGELQVLIKMLRRRPADLMHVYFGPHWRASPPVYQRVETPDGRKLPRHGHPAAAGSTGLR